MNDRENESRAMGLEKKSLMATPYEVGDIIKIKVKIDSRNPQASPKYNQPFDIDEFAILRFTVEETEEIKPIPINYFGNISVSGVGLPNDYMYHTDKIYRMIVVVKEINEKYGYQYDLVFCGEDFTGEVDIRKQRDFFEEILTPTQFTNLFELYDNPIKLLQDKDDDNLLKVKGIGEKNIKKLYEKFYINEMYMDAIIELGNYDITIDAIKKNSKLL